MHRSILVRTLVLVVAALWLVTGATVMAATEETKRQTINDGLVWLIGQQVVSGDEGYWSYSNDGTLAATGAAAMAFIEEGFLPGENVVIGIPPDTTSYGDVVGLAVNYIFNRAVFDSRFGVETAGYWRYAEDYNNDHIAGNDGGNDQAIYFEPGAYNRRLYTTGICAPVVFALGEALGMNTVIDCGSAAVNGRTYAAVMQDLIDWFCFAQVEPNRGNYRGGWRYDANWTDSDNSTAQWGSLPLLYADAWGLPTPDYVYEELERWVNYIQNPNGGSGYSNPYEYVNVAKTGGLLLELAAIGAGIGDSRAQNALTFINGRWNDGPSGTWYGNLNHPYAMWAVYKGLEVHAQMDTLWAGDGLRLMRYGFGMPAAPGGIDIGWTDDPRISAAGDWYSHYCQYLVDIQNSNGSWSGYSYWTGPLATAWYINILRASAGGHRMADPDIQITSVIDGDCVWYRTPVTHTIRYWFGTPGFPDPTVLPAENVEVTITLSPHLSFVSATGDYWWDGAQTVRWTRAEVPDGDEYFETIVTQGAGTVQPGMELVNFANISASNVPEELWDSDESRQMTCSINQVDVCVDIHPTSCPNPLNVAKPGVVPVAILGTADLDVNNIDPSTVLLEGVPPLRWSIEDVATPYSGGEPCGCTTDGPDGFDDLTLKFGAQELVAALGPFTDREVRELALTGSLLDQTLIVGTDCVLIIVPSHAPRAPRILRGPGPAEMTVTWERSEGPNFSHYAVYRGWDPAFIPDSPEDHLATSTDPTVVDGSVNLGEEYYYRVASFDEPVLLQTASGPQVLEVFSTYSDVGSAGMTTDVSALGDAPLVLSLGCARPNPFSSATQIAYTLPTTSTVLLSVYDVSGRLVEKLVEGVKPRGRHVAHWHPTGLASGTYFCRLQACGEERTQRVLLVK